MNAEQYLADPCGASSLPFWKTEQYPIPEGVLVMRDDEWIAELFPGKDEPYFKLRHELRNLQTPALPEGFGLVHAGAADFARHINSCYAHEGVTEEELLAYRQRQTYDPLLWLAVADQETGLLAATGIGELDRRIGEGILEWVQVSPAYRRWGLGRFLVCELLRRMQPRARFATVSGRLDSAVNPFALYTACGFTSPVIWHVIRKEKQQEA